MCKKCIFLVNYPFHDQETSIPKATLPQAWPQVFALGKLPFFLAFFTFLQTQRLQKPFSLCVLKSSNLRLKSHTLMSSPLSKSTREKPACFPGTISLERDRSASACSRTREGEPDAGSRTQDTEIVMAASQELLWSAFQDRARRSLDAWIHQLGVLGPVPTPVTGRKRDRQSSYRPPAG